MQFMRKAHHTLVPCLGTGRLVFGTRITASCERLKNFAYPIALLISWGPQPTEWQRVGNQIEFLRARRVGRYRYFVADEHAAPVEPVVAALVLALYFQLDLRVVELLADLRFGERLDRDQGVARFELHFVPAGQSRQWVPLNPLPRGFAGQRRRDRRVVFPFLRVGLKSARPPDVIADEHAAPVEPNVTMRVRAVQLVFDLRVVAQFSGLRLNERIN